MLAFFANTHKLNHSACDATKIIVKTSSSCNRNSKISNFFFKLLFYVRNFCHDFFVEIMVFAKFGGIFLIFVSSKKFDVTHKIALQIPKRMMRFSCVHFFARRKNKRGMSTHKSRGNQNFVENRWIVHNAFNQHSADARFKWKFRHHFSNARKRVVVFKCAQKIQRFNRAFDSKISRRRNKIELVKFRDSKFRHSQNNFRKVGSINLFGRKFFAFFKIFARIKSIARSRTCAPSASTSLIATCAAD